MTMYFLVRVEPAKQDYDEDPSLPELHWNGVPYASEAAYKRALVSDMKEDIDGLAHVGIDARCSYLGEADDILPDR